MNIREVCEYQKDVDPNELWDLLLDQLLLREGRLALPYYFETSTRSRDDLGPGMRLEIGAAASPTVFPARVNEYNDSLRVVEISLLQAKIQRPRPWRTYRFAVEASPIPNLTTLRLVLVHHYSLPRWIVMRFASLLGPSIAEMSLRKISRELR